MRRRKLALTAVALVLLPPAGARAATITVTTAADDLTPNDGTVSLREAIEAIDAGSSLGDPDITAESPGLFGAGDTIHFAIPGAGRQTILVGASGLGALPGLSRPVQIDGGTVPVGFGEVIPAIALDGAAAGGNANGLLVTAPAAGSTISGLDVFDFTHSQIELQGGGNAVSGDDIGWDTSGNPTRSPVGLLISRSSGNTIGGLTAAARNVISGNLGSGVEIDGTTSHPATGNVVEGNFIGTSAIGNAGNGNARFPPYSSVGAVQLSGADDNFIGGAAAGAGNVISANGSGIDLRNGASGNVVMGNLIGVAADGVTPLGNAGFGVRVQSSDGSPAPMGPGQSNEPAVADNVIGLNPNTSFSGAPNVIADNGQDGVLVDGSFPQNSSQQHENGGNSINGNSIYGNGGDGIDLRAATGLGQLPPNNSIAAPVVRSVVAAASSSIVDGSVALPHSPNVALRVEIFSSPACGVGPDGESYLGSTNANTDSGGRASFSTGVRPLRPGEVVSATVTNTSPDPSVPAGSANTDNTSEFSSCFTVPPRRASLHVSCSPGHAVVGQTVTCVARVSDISAGRAVGPTGTVRATAGRRTVSCALRAGSCRVSLTPVASGRLAVAARYPGDSDHTSSSVSFGLRIAKRATRTSVSCEPRRFGTGIRVSCTARVRDASPGRASSPTGIVRFPGASASCRLRRSGRAAAAICTTTITAHGQTVSAAYGGDAVHASSRARSG